MIRTTRLRLMTLHLGHMGFTEARTFMTRYRCENDFYDFRECDFSGVTSDQGFAGFRGGPTQDPGTLVGDRDGMFEMCRHAAIFGYRSPLIVEHLDGGGPRVYHRFDDDHKSAFQALTGSGSRVIWNRWVLVLDPPKTVAAEALAY